MDSSGMIILRGEKLEWGLLGGEKRFNIKPDSAVSGVGKSPVLF